MIDSSLRVLGNGGMVNRLLPHNGLVISGHFLVDCPPDVVRSFQTLDLQTLEIDCVFISHFHADHTFGFPFFILDRWIAGGFGGPAATKVEVFGPPGTTAYLTSLTEMGLQTGHPALDWFRKNVEIREVEDRENDRIGLFEIEFFRLRHIESSFGFSLRESHGDVIFSYLTDTIWGEEVERELRKLPKLVWLDMNGGSSGLHASYEDCIKMGIAITKDRTTYLGTHVSEPLKSGDSRIRMVSQGDRIKL